MAQQHRITFNPSFKPFYHGIASGDPMENKVIIWTRYTPDSGNVTSKLVYWQVATDPAFTNVVNYGKAYANESEDFTVKVDACGLQPNTFYYYLFSDGTKNSLVGRTKTAPGCHNFDIGTLLDAQGVAIRLGHHCTQPLWQRLGLEGSCRASFAFYNTFEEIDIFITALQKSISRLR